MNLHYRTAEDSIPVPGGIGVSSRCCCGLLVTGAGVSLRKAKTVIWLKMRDHRGMAAAAGPGWTGHAA